MCVFGDVCVCGSRAGGRSFPSLHILKCHTYTCTQHWSKVRHVADVLKAVLKALSPHYCLARGLFEIGSTYKV